jgi:hypothetical protein
MLMPASGITFVRRVRAAQHRSRSHQPLEHLVMRIDRLLTRLSFGIAAVAIVAGISFTLEYGSAFSVLR